MTQYPPRQSVLVTAPVAEPVTLAEVKLFLRIDGSVEDSLLDTLTTVAREMAEKYLAKMLMTQSWQMTQAYVALQDVALVPANVQAVTKVVAELNGELTTLSSNDYELDLNGKLKLKKQIQADKLIIDIVAGYGAAEDVPSPIRQGILHCISYLYHHREETAALCAEAKNLWNSYCEPRI